MWVRVSVRVQSSVVTTIGVALTILVVLGATGVVCVLGWVDVVMAVNTRGQL